MLRVAKRGTDTATATAHGYRLTLQASVATIASMSAARGKCLVGLPAIVGAVVPQLVWSPRISRMVASDVTTTAAAAADAAAAAAVSAAAGG